MGQVIVITSGKGGVGKSTTSANLGVALSLAGKSVVLVDADIGLRNLDVIMGLENRIVYDIVEVVEKKCKVKKALIKDKRFDNLYLLPAAQTRDKNAVSPEQMKKLTTELKEEFDFVIIDCPAGIEQGFQNAIAGADRALVVATPEVSSVRDADRIIGLLESSGISDIKLIVNRIKMKMVNKGEMMSIEDVQEILAIDLVGKVPDDEAIVVTTNKGEPAAMEGVSMAGKAYRNIAARIIGEDVAFLDLEPQKSFLDKVLELLGIKKKGV